MVFGLRRALYLHTLCQLQLDGVLQTVASTADLQSHTEVT